MELKRKKEIETLLHEETISLYNFFELNTVGKLLKFLTDLSKKNNDARRIEIDWSEISDYYEEEYDIKIYFTKYAPESDEAYNKRVKEKEIKDREKFEQLKEEYGWK